MYALIKNNEVIQIQPYKETGFVKVDDSVVCGMIKNGDAFENPQPSQEQIKQLRIAQIQSRLNQIDMESVRPIRAIQKGVGTEFDTQKLDSLENEAETLRSEIRTLEND